jgi:hypothetical protein
MKRSVKVDLSWRAWSLIVGFFILIGFVGLSFAYKSGASPSVMGHSAEEIEGGTGVAGLSLSCRIVSSTTTSPVTLCCDSDEYATGANIPEFNIKSKYTSDKCIYFWEVDSAESKQLICCKGSPSSSSGSGDSLLSQNGYQKLPSGLIMQWGKGAESVPVTFPIPFNALFSLTATSNYDGDYSLYIIDQTTTGFTAWIGPKTISPEAGFNWIAIGY